MSETVGIDRRILRMEFDNRKFEKNIAKSTKSVEDFKKAMNFDDTSSGLQKFAEAFSDLGLDRLDDYLERLADKFTGIGDAGEYVISRIRAGFEGAARSVESFIKSISTGQISVGKEKYNALNKAVMTIVSTGKYTEEQAYSVFERLMTYTNETSYSFANMVDQVSAFTSAGRGLQESERAMEGIANMSAKAGQGVAQANSAMQIFSKALGAGYLDLDKWQSLNLTAHVTTEEFRKTLLETAVEVGDLIEKDGRYQIASKYLTGAATKSAKAQEAAIVEVNNLETTLHKKWLTADTLMKTLEKYYFEDIDDPSANWDTFAGSAAKAAQRALSLADALNAMKEAVSAGWMTTYRLFWGDLSIAMQSFTSIANRAIEILDRIDEWRNHVLEFWATQGGRKSFLNILLGDYDKDIIEGAYGLMDLLEDAGNFISKGVSNFFKMFVPENLRQYWDDDGFQTAWFGGNLINFTRSIENFFTSIRDFFDAEVIVGGQAKSRLVLMSEIVQGIVAVIKFAYDIGSGLFGFFKQIAEQFQPSFDAILGFLGSLGISLYNSSQELVDSGEIVKFFKDLADVLRPLTGSINTVISALLDLFSTILDPIDQNGTSVSLFQAIANAILAIGKAISAVGVPITTFFRDVISAVKRLIQSGFTKGSFDVLVESIGSSASNLFTKLFDFVLSLLPKSARQKVKEVSGQIAEFLRSVFIYVRDRGGVIISGIVRWIGSIRGKIEPAFSRVLSFIRAMAESVVSIGKKIFADVSNWIRLLFAKKDADGIEKTGIFETIIQNLKDWKERILSGLRSLQASSPFLQTLSNFFKDINLSKLLLAFVGILGISGVIRLIKRITGIGKGLGSALGSFDISGSEANSKANSFLKISAAIALIAGAIVAVCYALNYVSPYFQAISRFLKTINLSSIITMLVGALGVIGVYKLVSQVIDLAKSVTGLVTNIADIAKSTTDILKNGIKIETKQENTATSMLKIAAAIGIVVAAIMAIALLPNPQGALTALGIITVIAIELAMVAYTVTKSFKDMNRTEMIGGIATLIGIAIAIGRIVIALQPLSKIEWPGLAKMGLGLVAIVASLSLLFKMMEKYSTEGVSEFGKVIYAIAAILIAINFVKNIDGEQLISAFSVLIVILGSIMIFMAVAKKINGTYKDLWQLAALVAGVAILALALQVMKNLDAKQLTMMTLGLAVILGGLAIFARAVRNAKLKDANLAQVIGLAFGIFFLIMALMPLTVFVNDEKGLLKLGVMFGGLYLILFALGSFSTKLNSYFGQTGFYKKGLTSIIGLAIGIFILIQALMPVARLVDDANTTKKFAAIVGALAVILAIMYAISKFGKSDVKSSAGAMMIIISLSLFLVVFAATLQDVRDVKWDTILAFSAGLAIFLLGIAKAISLASQIKFGKSIKAIIEIGAVIVAVLGIVYLARTYLPDIIGAFEEMSNLDLTGMATFVGGLVILVDGLALAISLIGKIEKIGNTWAAFALVVAGLVVVFGAFYLLKDQIPAIITIVEQIKDVDLIGMLKFAVGIAAIMSGIGVAIAIAGQIKNPKNGFAALVIMVLGMGMVVGLVYLLKDRMQAVIGIFELFNNIDLTGVLKFSVAIAAILGGIAFAISLAGKVDPDNGLGAILTLALGMALVIGVVALLHENMPAVIDVFNKMQALDLIGALKFAVTMAAIMSGIGLAVAIMGKIEFGQGLGNVVVLAAGFAAIIGILYLMNPMIPSMIESINQLKALDLGALGIFAVALIGIMAAVAVSIAIFSKVDFLTGLKGILLMAIGFAAIVGVIALIIPPLISGIGESFADAGSNLKLASDVFADFVGNMSKIEEADVEHGVKIIGKLKEIFEACIGFGSYSSPIKTFNSLLYTLGTSLVTFHNRAALMKDEGIDAGSALSMIKTLSGCAPDLQTLSDINLSSFSETMSALGGAMMLYAQGAKEVQGATTDGEETAGLEAAIRVLQGISTKLAEVGGFKIPADMPDETSLAGYGAKLAALAGALIQFEEAGSKLGSGTDKALETLDFFANIKKKLTEIGDFRAEVDYFTGENFDQDTFTTFGSNIESLGVALAAFAASTQVVDEKTGEVKPLNFDNALTALQSLGDLQEKLPEVPSIWGQWLIGRKGELSDLASEVVLMGAALKEFTTDSVEAFNSDEKKEAMKASLAAFDVFIEFANSANTKLPRVGGLMNLVTELFFGQKESINDAAQQMGDVGENLGKFSDSVSGKFKDPKGVEAALNALESFVDILLMMAKIADVQQTLGYNPTTLADNLITFINNLVGGISAEENFITGEAKMGAIDSLVTLMIGVAAKINRLGGINGQAIESFKDLAQALVFTSQIDVTKDFEGVGSAIASGVAKGILGGETLVSESARHIAIAAYNAAMNALDASSPSKLFTEVGSYIPWGLAVGIQKGSPRAIESIRDMCDVVLNDTREAFDIHSPSKEFQYLGEFNAAGLLEGMEQTVDSAGSQVKSFAANYMNSVLTNLDAVITDPTTKELLNQVIYDVSSGFNQLLSDNMPDTQELSDSLYSFLTVLVNSVVPAINDIVGAINTIITGAQLIDSFFIDRDQESGMTGFQKFLQDLDAGFVEGIAYIDAFFKEVDETTGMTKMEQATAKLREWTDILSADFFEVLKGTLEMFMPIFEPVITALSGVVSRRIELAGPFGFLKSLVREIAALAEMFMLPSVINSLTALSETGVDVPALFESMAWMLGALGAITFLSSIIPNGSLARVVEATAGLDVVLLNILAAFSAIGGFDQLTDSEFIEVVERGSQFFGRMIGSLVGAFKGTSNAYELFHTVSGLVDSAKAAKNIDDDGLAKLSNAMTALRTITEGLPDRTLWEVWTGTPIENFASGLKNYLGPALSDFATDVSSITNVDQVTSAIGLIRDIVEVAGAIATSNDLSQYNNAGYDLIAFLQMLSNPDSIIGLDWRGNWYAFGENLMLAFLEGFSLNSDELAAVVNDVVDHEPVITPVLDLTNVKHEAAYLNTLFGSGNYGLDMTVPMNMVNGIGFGKGQNQNGTDLTEVYTKMDRIDADIAMLGRNMISMGEQIGRIRLVLDTGALVGAMTDKMDAALGRKTFYAGRRN